ncbi:MAG: hypothetical protein KC468_16900 [Myxococcales bacterium]|nr:hypothetical protein [Myxococcales bacterium]
MLIATPARPDVLPPGEKGVGLSISVKAEVPEGKALVLARTFRGAMVITPGTPQEVEWHPLGGALQLRLVEQASVAKIDALREDMKRDEINALVEQGAACHEPFPGVRTVPESNPESGLRWVYAVEFAGDACTATLERTEKLDAAGVVLPAAPEEPPGPAKAEAGPPETKADEPKTGEPKADETKSGAGMCSVARRPEGSGALLVLVSALALGVGRRRRSRRAAAPS